jgi:iron complex outermembrane receptor protein
VNHWKVTNRSVLRRENSTLEVGLGFQSNFRQEWSQYVNHGFMPALFPDTLPFPSDLERQFEKHTYSGNIRYEFRTRQNTTITTGVQSEYMKNRIDGRDFIIPAFDQTRAGLYMLVKQPVSANGLLSAGLRYDVASIGAGAYNDWFPSPVPSGQDTIMVCLGRSDRFSRRFSNLTWTIGYNLNLEHYFLKVNLGKSFRMPLAKELAANGVNYHQFSYEVGNEDLSPEIAYQLDAGLEWHTDRVAIGVTPFVSYFPNYIYLNPGFEHDRLYGGGNQIFTYTQSRVFRYGGEVHAHYQLLKSLRMGLIGEYLYSVQLSGEKKGFGLPFAPPASVLLNLGYARESIWKLAEPYAGLDIRLVAAQRRIVPPESLTPGYLVLNLRIGSKVRIRNQELTVNLQLQNLLNTKYFDHTSYYKLINVPGPGRNLIINISIPFSGNLKHE